MKILHVTPHLDGDVGEGHAAIAAHLPDVVQQTFVVLTPQRDPRPVDRLRAAGARVVPGARIEHIPALAQAADIVQFEVWDDPRLREVLERCDFPAMRSVVRSHGAGRAAAASDMPAETGSPAQAAQDFMILWLGLLSEEPKRRDFRQLLAGAA
jgi:hypothetical protein